jgi:hypothetical protein
MVTTWTHHNAKPHITLKRVTASDWVAPVPRLAAKHFRRIATTNHENIVDVMKHGKLRSIAHNLADSLACGNGFLVGHYGMDVFGEAAVSDGGFFAVDFLTGKIVEGQVSESLARGIALYSNALPELCARHDTVVSEFSELFVRYTVTNIGKGFAVTIADRSGRRSTTDYQGIDSQRAKVLDDEGRLRRKPVRRS